MYLQQLWIDAFNFGCRNRWQQNHHQSATAGRGGGHDEDNLFTLASIYVSAVLRAGLHNLLQIFQTSPPVVTAIVHAVEVEYVLDTVGVHAWKSERDCSYLCCWEMIISMMSMRMPKIPKTRTSVSGKVDSTRNKIIIIEQSSGPYIFY